MLLIVRLIEQLGDELAAARVLLNHSGEPPAWVLAKLFGQPLLQRRIDLREVGGTEVAPDGALRGFDREPRPAGHEKYWKAEDDDQDPVAHRGASITSGAWISASLSKGNIELWWT